MKKTTTFGTLGTFLTFLTVALMANSALAQITDDFSGTYGPQQNWQFQDATGTNTETWLNNSNPTPPNPYATAGIDVFDVTMSGACNLDGTGATSPFYTENVGAILLDPSDPLPSGQPNPYAYTSHAYIEASVNTDASGNTTGDNNDNNKGLMLSFQHGTDTKFYMLNYNPYWKHLGIGAYDSTETEPFMDLVHGDLDALAGDDPAEGDILDIQLDMKFQANIISAGQVNLVGQGWGDIGNGYELLAEVQFRVGVNDPEDGEAGDVPILTSGACGFYSQMNSSAVEDGITPDFINTTFDDFLTRDGLEGDFNLDGEVDVSDLGILATNYGASSDAMWSQGNADLDGDVDVSDLGILATNYGAGTVAGGNAIQAPEPATMSLLGVGVLALIRRRRK